MQLAGKIVVAVSVPLVAAVVWALIVAPSTPLQVGSVARFGIECLVFVAAIAALITRQRLALALIFTAL